jgi:cell division protein FtsQ
MEDLTATKTVVLLGKNVSARALQWGGAVVFVAILLIWAAIKLDNPYSFPITTVQVKGDYSHVSNQQLEKIITPYLHASFFGLHSFNLQHALQQIPWVGPVNVRRVFPGTVEITVNEKQPVLVWNNTQLLTAQGVAFSPAANTFPKNLPALNGPGDEQQNMLQTQQQLNQLLQPLQLSVQQLVLSDRRAWTMVLNNGITVTLGKQNIWPRMQQFVAVYPKVVGNKAKRAISVDLRYPNGFTVQWKR